MTSREWRHVRRSNPCPVCGKGDWCLLAADGSAAICARIESPKRCGQAGWLHRLTDSPWRSSRRIIRHIPMTGGGPDLGELAEHYQRDLDPGRLHQLAETLGLTADNLVSFGVGWTGRAWSFPMKDTTGRVCGIRLRGLNGAKWSVRGGREGLFLPAGLDLSSDKRLLICEGPTDCAALLDLGCRAVVGRPSCTGGVKLLVELVQQRRPAEIVIVADGDEPGRRGADNLLSVLLCYCGLVRVIVPRRFKDVRDFLRAGGTREQLEQAIAAAPARKLQITSKRVGNER